jgi:hypothetical protein
MLKQREQDKYTIIKKFKMCNHYVALLSLRSLKCTLKAELLTRDRVYWKGRIFRRHPVAVKKSFSFQYTIPTEYN